MANFHPERRNFCRDMTLLGAAGLGMTDLMVQSNAIAAQRNTMPACIDVHQHYVPDVYRRAAEAAGHGKPDGMPAIPRWDRQMALDMMDRCNIGSGVLSISSPGVHFGDAAAARSLARAVNEEGAGLVAKYPTRFGLFASIPLPDVDAALREIEYSLDVLHADGIALKTNHHGIYLGDARFDPIFAELNRRAAVIFIHPTSPYCPACQAAPGETGIGYPAPMIEFMFETTRAITHLVFSGTLQRYPRLRIIVPHAGATLPTLSDRIAGMIPALGLTQPPSTEQVLASLRGLYYDLAGHAVPKMLDALLLTTEVKHLLYGSDWPFTSDTKVSQLQEQLANTERFDAQQRLLIARTNALSLLPRLQAALAS